MWTQRNSTVSASTGAGAGAGPGDKQDDRETYQEAEGKGEGEGEGESTDVSALAAAQRARGRRAARTLLVSAHLVSPNPIPAQTLTLTQTLTLNHNHHAMVQPSALLVDVLSSLECIRGSTGGRLSACCLSARYGGVILDADPLTAPPLQSQSLSTPIPFPAMEGGPVPKRGPVVSHSTDGDDGGGGGGDGDGDGCVRIDIGDVHSTRTNQTFAPTPTLAHHLSGFTDPLILEDPLQPENNLTHSSFALPLIERAFDEALQRFRGILRAGSGGGDSSGSGSGSGSGVGDGGDTPPPTNNTQAWSLLREIFD
jgi:hypothetical protein